VFAVVNLALRVEDLVDAELADERAELEHLIGPERPFRWVDDLGQWQAQLAKVEQIRRVAAVRYEQLRRTPRSLATQTAIDEAVAIATPAWTVARVTIAHPDPDIHELDRNPMPGYPISPRERWLEVGPFGGERAWLDWRRGHVAAGEAVAVLNDLRRRFPYAQEVRAPDDKETVVPDRHGADGSKKKRNDVWRHRMRVTDRDVKRGVARRTAFESHGWDFPESRQGGLNWEHWWAELERDNPDMAAR
jgi:hypothetical protein